MSLKIKLIHGLFLIFLVLILSLTTSAGMAIAETVGYNEMAGVVGAVSSSAGQVTTNALGGNDIGAGVEMAAGLGYVNGPGAVAGTMSMMGGGGSTSFQTTKGKTFNYPGKVIQTGTDEVTGVRIDDPHMSANYPHVNVEKFSLDSGGRIITSSRQSATYRGIEDHTDITQVGIMKLLKKIGVL